MNSISNSTDTTIQRTTSGDEMKNWLHNMTAHGGGDCPEMALAGTINGKVVKLLYPFIFLYLCVNRNYMLFMISFLTLILILNICIIYIVVIQCIHFTIYTFSVYVPLCLHWKSATYNFL